MAAVITISIIRLLGLLVFLDGALSLGWYKEDLKGGKGELIRTLFRLWRVIIGVCLVLIS